MAAPGATPPVAPPMPKMTPMLITMAIIVVVMMFNKEVGGALNVVFQFIALYESPVLTLIIAGIIMTSMSMIVRSFMTDTVKQQRSQSEMKAFQAELRKARIENNLYKIKKLSDQQQAMMAKSMEGTGAMMKTMPITMLIVIPIFAWVRYFIDHLVTEGYNTVINIPWGLVDLNSSILFLPSWILIYTLISIPFGQLVSRLIRTYLFKKRLKELEAGGNGGIETEIEVL